MMKEILDTAMQFIMTWLDPIGIVVGLVLSIPVIWTWYEVTLGRKRRQRRWFNEVRKQPGRRPGILVIDLLDSGDARTAVENHRQQDDELKNIPQSRVFHIRRDRRLQPEDIPALMEEIDKTYGQIMASGIDTLHYFHAGPAFTAAIAGARLSNGCRVKLYHHKAGAYTCYGTLQLEE